jgi:hypothetical protein
MLCSTRTSERPKAQERRYQNTRRAVRLRAGRRGKRHRQPFVTAQAHDRRLHREVQVAPYRLPVLCHAHRLPWLEKEPDFAAAQARQVPVCLGMGECLAAKAGPQLLTGRHPPEVHEGLLR